MKADGSNVHPITSDGINKNPTWSNDGGTIVYQCKVNGAYKICTIDTNGNNRRVLTTGSSIDAEPVWMP